MTPNPLKTPMKPSQNPPMDSFPTSLISLQPPMEAAYFQMVALDYLTTNPVFSITTQEAGFSPNPLDFLLLPQKPPIHPKMVDFLATLEHLAEVSSTSKTAEFLQSSKAHCLVQQQEDTVTTKMIQATVHNLKQHRIWMPIQQKAK